MTDKDSSLIAELERRLYWYREEASEEEFDAEEVDAICVMLQKLSPMEKPRMSKEEVRRNIMKRVQEEDGVEDADGFSASVDGDGADRAEKTDGAEKANRKVKKSEKGGGKKRRLFRKSGYRAAALFIAVFGAALVSLNMVTYAREDKSLFTMILERVGLVEIVKDASAEREFLYENDNIKTFYDNWGELDSELKSKIIVPQYIPNDFVLYGIRYYNLNDRDKVRADYYDKEDGHLVITITLWKDTLDQYREMTMDEKTCILLPEYSDENTLYYEYEDEYICMTSVEKNFYRISGNISLEKLIKVREGLK